MDVKQLSRETIRDFILGGQDGLVNVLGLLLGVAAATNQRKIVLIAGISALMAESISMGAVAYTSSKAAKEYYLSKVAFERREIRNLPGKEEREIREIYYRKGFRGKLLQQMVKKITSNKKLLLETLMTEQLRMFPEEYARPVRNGVFVFWATVLGSSIPLLPFFFVSVKMGIVISVIISLLALFITGAIKAKLTIGSWKRSGWEMMLIGGLAAVVGYLIGKGLEFL